MTDLYDCAYYCENQSIYLMEEQGKIQESQQA